MSLQLAMKRIVLCCDGTWNTADQVNEKGVLCSTNVIKMAVRAKKHADDGTQQIVYYDQGVGTGNVMDRMIGGAFGDGLEGNIHDAYRFLIANYEPGDQIYIFGFSRGAFTARSIGGMVRKCGILRRERVREYPKTTQLYRQRIKPTDPAAVEHRRANAIEPETSVHCIGVWDTVGALGVPVMGAKEHEFHDTSLSSTIKFAFHALAIDEHRRAFAPTLWDNAAPAAGQTVEQVWFAGAHSDVGGGYGETGLSDIAFEWMMDRAEKAGLELDPMVRRELGTTPAFDAELHNSKKGLFMIRPGLDREIGKYKTEYLHRDVIRRWQKDPKYRPDSLEPHAARIAALLAGPLKDDVYPL